LAPLSSSCRIQSVEADPLVQISDLIKYFAVRKTLFSREEDFVHAVDGVDLEICRGETLGLVGESGCGKSTLGKVILALEKPTSGKVIFERTNVHELTGKALKAFRQNISVIFQDPYSSLNPRKTVRSIVMEPLVIHKIGAPKDRLKKVYQLMDEVGLRPEYADRYPHEFSGGQRQRIGIARALALNPKLIIADEPVSALDVSIRAQVLNLMEDLQEKFGLTYLFISHDLSVVEHIADRVAVMYLGKIVEIGPKRRIYENTLHPYTEALMSAVPIPDPTLRRKRIMLEGDVPSPINPPTGCRFHPRCWLRIPVCVDVIPPLQEMSEGHAAACHVRAPADFIKNQK
jgi:oligopeptide/dipeptide ABC transporter ATP-binding protein